MDIYDDTELQHSGTKNQKWGQRLYQNKDGSLTPLGRIRYRQMAADRRRAATKIKKDSEKSAAKAAKKEAKNEAKKQAAAEKAEAAKLEQEAKAARDAKVQKEASDTKERIQRASKKTVEMSDEELTAAIERLNLEKRYKELFNQVNPPAPAKKTGADFVKNLIVTKGGEAVSSVAGKTMTYLLGNMVDNMLGVKVNTGKVKKIGSDDKDDKDDKDDS